MDEEIVEEFRELFNFDKAKKNVILNLRRPSHLPIKCGCSFESMRIS